MHEGEAWSQPDLLARPESMALAELRHHLAMADTREDLRFGAGRLDDDDLRFDAVIRERQVLRTDSVNGRLPIARARRTVEGELDTGFGDEARRSVERNPPLAEIHRRRADEPRHKQVGRLIVSTEERRVGKEGVSTF